MHILGIFDQEQGRLEIGVSLVAIDDSHVVDAFAANRADSLEPGNQILFAVIFARPSCPGFPLRRPLENQ